MQRRANMAHTRQSRPDCGILFQVKVLEMFEGFRVSYICMCPDILFARERTDRDDAVRVGRPRDVHHVVCVRPERTPARARQHVSKRASAIGQHDSNWSAVSTRAAVCVRPQRTPARVRTGRFLPLEPFSLEADPSRTRSSQPAVERLRENLADFNEKLFKKLYQNRLDGHITCHVLVQIFLNS